MTLSASDGAALRGCGWYAGLPDDLSQAIAAQGHVVTLDDGQTAYLEGDDQTGLWIILSGLVRLEMTAGAERSALLALIGAGGLFGRSRFSGSESRLVSVRAARPTRALLLSDRAVDRIAASHPHMWRAVAQALQGQIDQVLTALSQQLALSPRQRVAARLIAFDREGEVAMSQADLAEMCGLSRKAVNAHLGALAERGLVRCGYGAITITNAAALAEAARR